MGLIRCWNLGANSPCQKLESALITAPVAKEVLLKSFFPNGSTKTHKQAIGNSILFQTIGFYRVMELIIKFDGEKEQANSRTNEFALFSIMQELYLTRCNLFGRLGFSSFAA